MGAENSTHVEKVSADLIQTNGDAESSPAVAYAETASPKIVSLILRLDSQNETVNSVISTSRRLPARFGKTRWARPESARMIREEPTAL